MLTQLSHDLIILVNSKEFVKYFFVGHKLPIFIHFCCLKVTRRQVGVEFDSETNRASMSAAATDCAAVLSPNSLSLVDGIAPAKCVWQSDTTLVTPIA